MFNLIKRLLPRTVAWYVIVEGPLRSFFQGLAEGLLQPAREFVDTIWANMFPDTTQDLTAWEWQFGLQDTGLSEADRRTRVDSTWKALVGGQDPRYIQDTLQASGFDVYVHDWWVPGSNPAVSRDPFDVDFGSMLVNKIYTVEPSYTGLCGEPGMECGEVAAECGQYAGFDIDRLFYPIPTDPNDWPWIIYIGGETWGTTAEVDPERRDEFEDLCLRICPDHNWIMLNVIFGETSILIDGDMEDLDIPDWDEGSGGNILPDGNMEADGIDYWVNFVGYQAAKSTSVSHSGSQSLVLTSQDPS